MLRHVASQGSNRFPVVFNVQLRIAVTFRLSRKKVWIITLSVTFSVLFSGYSLIVEFSSVFFFGEKKKQKTLHKRNCRKFPLLVPVSGFVIIRPVCVLPRIKSVSPGSIPKNSRASLGITICPLSPTLAVPNTRCALLLPRMCLPPAISSPRNHTFHTFHTVELY